MIGIIGGSGLYSGLKELGGEERKVRTKFGDVPVLAGENFVFISRHGNPPVPPHMVKYHANIDAFRAMRIKYVVAISSVGSLRNDIAPGSIVLPDDLLDFTGRVWTYHNDEPVHANLYEPFCPELREKLEKMVDRSGGTYATTKGPQFETRAEANMLRTLGADVVGMTVAPEARLARELDICYQPICLVVNYVDGNTTHENTVSMVKKMESRISEIVRELIKSDGI
ncbi:MAG: MTAP family purine nucleoside phosphorylase [Euryarchaeota archaeon]|nr:MTAP family purine nucleoside phosphorylase [Euryarchaeota archaeon]